MTPGLLILIAVLGIALLLFLVIRLRLQAVLALLIASYFVAILGGVPLNEIAQTIQEGMGNTLGFIAVVVGVGTMIGEMLRVSGGAEQLAQTLVRKFGDDKAPWALGLTGLLVSIPVFFDVGLIILIPLVYGLAQRTGRSLLYYAIPLAAGLAIGHAYIPPTPGPVAVASLLGADLGWVILFGAIAGFVAMVCGGIFFGKYISDRIHAKVPEYMILENYAGSALVDDEDEPADRTQYPDASPSTEYESRTVATQERVDPAYDDRPVEPGVPATPDRAPKAPHPVAKEPPSFGLVLGLIAIPLVLILLNTVSGVLLEEGNPIRNFLAFIGHPFFALILAALITFYTLGTRRGYSRREIQEIATKSLEPVGLIILVTGAGGVFGRTLVATGVGEALANAMTAFNMPIMLLAFLIATAVRVSQGSATVSMVTAAGLMAPIVELGNYSPPMIGLITIAISSGATVLSHVNDSGFWLVSRYLGISEKNTLRSWTMLATILGVVGFLVVFIISFFV
ncbi:GntP family permease [Egbenema bharatensis]|uniref:GntP family permease n=1 Tax=Egbenema bharatensis TaxID=3463334 RepID=UPI003A8C355E